jgi:hypothetical protein
MAEIVARVQAAIVVSWKTMAFPIADHAIIATKGFRGLFAALDRGVELPAALAPIAAGAVAASQYQRDE